MEGLSQQVNLSIKKNRETQLELIKNRAARESAHQIKLKEVETEDQAIKSLLTKQSQNWESLKLSLQNQSSEIDTKTNAIQSAFLGNQERINSLGKTISWMSYPIIRWILGSWLKPLQQERETLLATNTTLGNLGSSLKKIKNETDKIASSNAQVTDFKSLQDEYKGLENFRQKESIRQFIPNLFSIEKSDYAQVSGQILELENKKQQLTSDAKIIEDEVLKLNNVIAGLQEKMKGLESDKEKTFTDLLIEAHGKETKVIDLTHMRNKHFLLHLQSSAEQGNIDPINLIMEHCIRLDAPNSNGDNALHLAARNGKIEAARWLLSRKEQWHSKNKDGNTPLHFAALGEKPEMVSLLLDELRDKNSNFKNNRGNTPLHEAVSKGNLEILNLLLSDLKTKKQEWNVPNASGHTPLYSAVSQ